MAIYSNYTLESTGASYTSMNDFGNASVGTIIIRSDGRRYIKNSKGVWETAPKADYLNINKLTIGNSNAQTAPVAGAGTIKYQNGSLFYSDGISWNYIFSKKGTWKYFMSPDKGFVFGGYKSSTAWKCVNRINYSSDTTTIIGDTMNGAVSYKDAMASKIYSYILGVNVGSSGYSYTSSKVGRQHHVTETYNQAGDMPRAVTNGLRAVDEFKQIGYMSQGGSTAIDKLAFDTETWSTITATSFTSGTGAYGGVHGENYGHFNGGDAASYTVLAFNTLTTSNIANVPNIGATRGMVCSEDYAWHFGSSSTSRYNVKVSYTTNTGTTAGSYSASLGTFWQESNNTGMPQADTGYFSGGYNGVQAAHGGKFNAVTEVAQYISSLNMKGAATDGASSAAAAWNYNGY